MEAILEQPDTTLAEIAYNVFALTGLENAVSSILRYLKRNTFTCKKVCTNFFYKVDQKLCPNLLPLNGVNPRSVVIMGKVKLFATPTTKFSQVVMMWITSLCLVGY